MNRNLEVHRPALATRVDEPHLSVVVLRESPLPAVRAGRLAQNAAGRPAEAERVVGAVDPVVETPDEPALLVFEVAVTAEADARVEDLARVGDAVTVGVSPLDHVVGLRLVDEDAVLVERQDHARQDELVDEGRVRVVVAVAGGALPAADHAGRCVLPLAGAVGHIGPQLRDVHPPVAVELDDARTVDVGIGEDKFHAVTSRQQKGRRLFGGRTRAKRRLGREVRAAVVLCRATSAGRQWSGGAAARPLSRRRCRATLRGRLSRLCSEREGRC